MLVIQVGWQVHPVFNEEVTHLEWQKLFARIPLAPRTIGAVGADLRVLHLDDPIWQWATGRVLMVMGLQYSSQCTIHLSTLYPGPGPGPLMALEIHSRPGFVVHDQVEIVSVPAAFLTPVSRR